jgi:hypothetical protein
MHFIMRTLIAFLCAPVIPALFAGWVVGLNRTYAPISMFIFVCLAFYALQVIVGIPAYIFMSRKHMHRLRLYLLLGGLAAALPMLLMVAWRHTEQGYSLADYAYLYYPALLGTGTGLMFWVLARPDKQANAAPQSN